jgi:hypothetical protein
VAVNVALLVRAGAVGAIALLRDLLVVRVLDDAIATVRQVDEVTVDIAGLVLSDAVGAIALLIALLDVVAADRFCRAFSERVAVGEMCWDCV